jgi:hypothetical protein
VIGWSGILVQLLMVGGFFFFSVVSLKQVRKAPTWRNILLVLVFVPISVLLVWKQAAHVLYLRSLHRLRAETVVQITVNGTVFRNEPDKLAIVSALNDSRWFEPKHGGWRKPSSISISMKSGETLQYSVAFYHSGAVILGRQEAFSDTLPKVLSTLGCPLSTELNR